MLYRINEKSQEPLGLGLLFDRIQWAEQTLPTVYSANRPLLITTKGIFHLHLHYTANPKTRKGLLASPRPQQTSLIAHDLEAEVAR